MPKRTQKSQRKCHKTRSETSFKKIFKNEFQENSDSMSQNEFQEKFLHRSHIGRLEGLVSVFQQEVLERNSGFNQTKYLGNSFRFRVFVHFELSVNLVLYLSDKSRQKWDLQNSCMDHTAEGYGNVHTENLAQTCKMVDMGAKSLSYISEPVILTFPIGFCVRWHIRIRRL